MRIIHTGDWHLCDRLGRVNRTEDLKVRTEDVARLCEEHGVDVLLIAGDVFSEQASVEEMALALTHLHQVFGPFFERGGTILAITGNHDHENRIELIRHAMRLAVPTAVQRQFQPGRMYLLNRPYFGAFQSLAGECAQFVLIPYPTVSRYSESNDSFRGKDEMNRLLQLRIAEEIQRASKHAEFDKALPTILAAHLHVHGAELHTLYKITEQDDVVFDTGFLPTAWAYIALGHIHKPQALPGLDHVRYCGSLDRLDFGERGDDKGVVLLDLGPIGLRGQPMWLPIEATPMHDVIVMDPAAELPMLAERYLDREKALVRLQVLHNPAGPSRDEIVRQLRQLFPRHTGEITWLRPEGLADSATTKGFKPRADYRATIRDFLSENEKLAKDADKEDVIALAESFFTEASHDS